MVRRSFWTKKLLLDEAFLLASPSCDETFTRTFQSICARRSEVFHSSSEKNVLIWMRKFFFMMAESSAKLHILIRSEVLGEFAQCGFEWGRRIYRSFHHVLMNDAQEFLMRKVVHYAPPFIVFDYIRIGEKVILSFCWHAHRREGERWTMRRITLNKSSKSVTTQPMYAEKFTEDSA